MLFEDVFFEWHFIVKFSNRIPQREYDDDKDTLLNVRSISIACKTSNFSSLTRLNCVRHFHNASFSTCAFFLAAWMRKAWKKIPETSSDISATAFSCRTKRPDENERKEMTSSGFIHRETCFSFWWILLLLRCCLTNDSASIRHSYSNYVYLARWTYSLYDSFDLRRNRRLPSEWPCGLSFAELDISFSYHLTKLICYLNLIITSCWIADRMTESFYILHVRDWWYHSANFHTNWKIQFSIVLDDGWLFVNITRKCFCHILNDSRYLWISIVFEIWPSFEVLIWIFLSKYTKNVFGIKRV